MIYPSFILFAFVCLSFAWEASAYNTQKQLKIVNLYNNEDFRGSEEQFSSTFTKCMSLNRGNRHPNSAKLMSGSCVRLCDESCGDYPQSCVYLTRKNSKRDNMKPLNLQIRSIRQCEDADSRTRWGFNGHHRYGRSSSLYNRFKRLFGGY